MSEATKNATRLPMITAARVGFTKALVQELVLGDKKKQHKLFHVVGSASTAKVKESKDYEDKESIEFGGAFMAINAETGEQFKSGKLYLPSVIEAEFAAMVQAHGLVEMSMTVIAEYAEKAATSYVYNIISYGKEDNRAFDAMLALIPGMKKALPAPDKGEDEAPAGGKKAVAKGGGKKGK